MTNPIVDYVVTIVTGLPSIFPGVIFLWFFISLAMYFFLLRPLFKHFAIRKPEMTKKERKARQKADREQPGGDTIDVIFSGINKTSLWRFKRWLLCDCYRDEDKTRWFGLFKVICCICLVFFSVVSVLMILGAWLTAVRLAAAIGMFICLMFSMGLMLFCGVWFWFE